MTQESSRGAAYGFLAYGLWGLFPIYFHALAPAGAWEVLAHRVLWTLAVCILVLLIRRDWAWLREVAREPRLALTVVAAALVIAINWVVYVYAVLHGHTNEAALGYFLNPIVSVALGVAVLGERLRRLQWIAVGFGVAAALLLAAVGGTVPWVAFAVAFSFGIYGLLKKQVGPRLTAMHSLAAETMVLIPIAGALLIWLTSTAQSTFSGHGGWHAVLLVLSGPVTAVPLLLFAAAARRVPLVTIGLIQFITPILQLLCAVLLLGEQVSTGRWIGFGIVWIALVLLAIDSVQSRRSPKPVDPVEPTTL